MDSSHPFVVRYKIHSNKEEWPCCDICVILCFIYVYNAISDSYSYNLRLHNIINKYTDLILEITENRSIEIRESSIFSNSINFSITIISVDRGGSDEPGRK